LSLLDAVTADGGYTVEPDIAYGTLPGQFIDIYRPLGPVYSNRPVLVFFYGGSWTSGDRGSYRFIGQSFASAGYVTVVADYRHYPEARFPGFVEDGAAAVALVARYVPGAAGHIVVIGHSSGAYIAAMVASDRRYLDAAGSGRAVLAGFIGVAGPYDFALNGPVAQLLASPDGRPNMPIATIDGHEPPSLLLVAVDDTLVPTGNTDRFAARLTALGDEVQVLRYDGPSHGRLVAALGTALPDFAPTERTDVLAFLQARQMESVGASRKEAPSPEERRFPAAMAATR
jgi:acetyl esterase/lipase